MRIYALAGQNYVHAVSIMPVISASVLPPTHVGCVQRLEVAYVQDVLVTVHLLNVTVGTNELLAKYTTLGINANAQAQVGPPPRNPVRVDADKPPVCVGHLSDFA